MATIQQENEMRVLVAQALDAIVKIQPESLVRPDLGKDLNFEAALPIFQRTLNLYKALSECNLDAVPYESLTVIRDQLNQVGALFGAVKAFSLQANQQNPLQARDSLVNQLRDRWQQDYATITPHIAYAIRRGTDFDALEREARGTLALQHKLGAEFKAEKDKILAEMQGALERVRQAAAEAGVAQHAIHFKEEAEFHSKQSLWWLGAAVAFGVATMGYAWYEQSSPLATTVSVLEAILPRLVVIVILTFGLVWSARNYAASRHNFVVNRHRQNALSSFETFVKGAGGDPETKHAILLQATQSIFIPQDSGFVKGDTAPQPGSQIIEIMRGVTPKQ